MDKPILISTAQQNTLNRSWSVITSRSAYESHIIYKLHIASRRRLVFSWTARKKQLISCLVYLFSQIMQLFAIFPCDSQWTHYFTWSKSPLGPTSLSENIDNSKFMLRILLSFKSDQNNGQIAQRKETFWLCITLELWSHGSISQNLRERGVLRGDGARKWRLEGEKQTRRRALKFQGIRASGDESFERERERVERRRM